MTADLHVDDIGTGLRFTIKENNVALDLPNAGIAEDDIVLHLQKKDKTVIFRPVEYATDGKDGKVIYFTQAGDIDQKGKWSGQVYLESTSGSWHTSKVTIEVDDNLDS